MAEKSATAATEEASAPAQDSAVAAKVREDSLNQLAGLLPELSRLLENDGLKQLVRDQVRDELVRQLDKRDAARK